MNPFPISLHSLVDIISPDWLAHTTGVGPEVVLEIPGPARNCSFNLGDPKPADYIDPVYIQAEGSCAHPIGGLPWYTSSSTNESCIGTNKLPTHSPTLLFAFASTSEILLVEAEHIDQSRTRVHVPVICQIGGEHVPYAPENHGSN